MAKAYLIYFLIYITNIKKEKNHHLAKSKSYTVYLFVLSIIPITSLWFKFEKIQLLYAIVGALFMPLLALSLISLTNRKELKEMKSNVLQNLIYVLIFISFMYFGYLKLTKA